MSRTTSLAAKPLLPVLVLTAAAVGLWHAVPAPAQAPVKKGKAQAKNETKEETGEFDRFGIYEKTAPRPAATEPVATTLPLELRKGDRIALIGNTLLERSQEFGQLEALLHQQFP